MLGEWLLDLVSARKLGRAPTGHAAGAGVSTTNMRVRPGAVSLGELMADIKDGVLLTEVVGQGVNYTSGDYSRGASGFRIIDGAIAGPVAGFTIAGNLKTMFAAIETVGTDVDVRSHVRTGSILVGNMTVAGTGER